ncbi:MAG: lysophospholipid acyltransferase family protein [Luteolibacter sp.]
MLQFSDAPYQFFEAKPSPPLIWLGRTLNRHIILPGKNHRISGITIEGETQALIDARDAGHRLLFVMNHPSHSDPQVVTEVHRRLGIPSCFMAAYDVFLRGKSAAWAMQRMGNFSIDREGSDRKAMAAAIEILKKGDRALNIFPEGNVYLTNDRVTPFLDGAAFIALKAQAALGDTPVTIIPLSLKFTHLTTPRETITARMLQLATDSGYQFPEGSTANPVKAVLGLGQHILSLYLEKHGQDLHEEKDGKSLFNTLETFATSLVTDTEQALEITPGENEELVSRIAKVRSNIHALRTDPESRTQAGTFVPKRPLLEAPPIPRDTPPKNDQSLDGLADQAILALRIHGYLQPYLTGQPTIDRYDETVERIAEDFYSKAMPRTGPRKAMLRIGTPIDVRDYSGEKLRVAISRLTSNMEAAVQTGISELNQINKSLGNRACG